MWTNCYHLYPAHAAFGGYKVSGVGRENHKMMLDHYTQTKCLLVSYDPKPLGLLLGRWKRAGPGGSSRLDRSRQLAAIGRLRARHGPLVFFQSGGCCDGSSPMCLREGELLLGPDDVLLGEVAGCPFYVDGEQYERWRRPSFVLDVAAGGGDSFSLEGPDGLHFVARSPSETVGDGGVSRRSTRRTAVAV